MAAARRKIDPDDVPADVKREARRLATAAFETLGCDGVARIDFLYDLDTGRLWFNEINTLPGSLSYYLWERSDPPRTYTALLSQLIDAAVAAHQARRGPEASGLSLKPLFRGA
jgi:D-alanine-D-alanine ligase